LAKPSASTDRSAGSESTASFMAPPLDTLFAGHNTAAVFVG
jgi:hypothetical protein